ncbi:Mitochondrial import receptor subunit TOM5 [Nakaseomyces bracarensis]|uniref:Mitochondrial import receptor subunit TOM5 n=1 Tax=Nakaseomyces bracarensis TaxID=273131 RepID=A0ABR4P0J2_9SACH
MDMFMNQESEEEKKLHQKRTEQTLMNAACVAAFLWVSPMVWNFVKKQWK